MKPALQNHNNCVVALERQVEMPQQEGHRFILCAQPFCSIIPI
jgi:hypothetical protein